MSAQEVLDFFKDNKEAIGAIVTVLGLLGGFLAYREAIKEWRLRQPKAHDSPKPRPDKPKPKPEDKP
jgi:hypothetical protein